MPAPITDLQAIILGLLQGVSELFPVSSLGHSVIAPALFGWHHLVSAQAAKHSFFLAFLVGLHVGTAAGLFVYYRRTWVAFARALIERLRGVGQRGVSSLWRLDDDTMDANYRLLTLLVVATIPVGIAGVIFDSTLRVLFAKPLAAAVFLVINGLILFGAERLRAAQGRHARLVSLETLSVRQAFGIGASQSLALFAGISRSGIAMASGLAGGLSHEDAAQFSFLLATPVIALAGLYKLPELFGAAGQGVRTPAALGALCAAVTAYLSVRFLVRWFATKTLAPFALYSLALGLFGVVYFA